MAAQSPTYTPSPTLVEGLARSSDGGRPLYELVVPRRDLVDDVSLAPDDATFIALNGVARNVPRIAGLRKLEALWANIGSPGLFEAARKAPSLRAIYVYQLKQLTDVSLGGAPKLEHLMLSWAPKLVDLSFLTGLPALRTIYLEDMKRLDLTTLPDLPHVTGLHIGGGMWSKLEFESLEPIMRLPGLRYLRLSNARPIDGRLEPLSRLQHLRELDLPNFFELEEVARLSGALPDVKSNTLTPVFAPVQGGAIPADSPYRCERCGGRKQMMTGKPASLLCPMCDEKKFQRRVARWEIARAEGWTR